VGDVEYAEDTWEGLADFLEDEAGRRTAVPFVPVEFMEDGEDSIIEFMEDEAGRSIALMEDDQGKTVAVMEDDQGRTVGVMEDDQGRTVGVMEDSDGRIVEVMEDQEGRLVEIAEDDIQDDVPRFSSPARSPILSSLPPGGGDFLLAQTCSPTPNGYSIADPHQCDRYLRCSPDGTGRVSLCPDGLVFNKKLGACDYMSKTSCAGRPLLQAPTGSGSCPRANGFFPLPAEESCSQYVSCHDGAGHLQQCGSGAVFDTQLATCVHPDQTTRTGCTAQELYKFRCPVYKGQILRFGNHDRLPHPLDCALFYICLTNGQPRLSGCPRPTVFNPATGICALSKEVKGCEAYYLEEEEKMSEKDKERARMEDEVLLDVEKKHSAEKIKNRYGL